MLTKKRIPLLSAYIFCFELIIYLWAVWTTKPEFIFAKCARNSGRVSSAIVLAILLMIGYYGLKKIYADDKKKEFFRVLITVFAINHIIHFFYLYMNFKGLSKPLITGGNMHGIITFVCIMIMPFIVWKYQKLSSLLYCVIILHLFNVTYFIDETFWSKVKPGHPAYHNQFGIVVMTAACFYIMYRIFSEYKENATANS